MIQKVISCPFQRHPPIFKDVGSMADLKGVMDILLNEEDGAPPFDWGV
jgi:hypothetical protein